MSNLVGRWQEAKQARRNAEEWNALPTGPAYGSSKFAISEAHCKAPMLTRAGQQSCGGTNYWETDKAFNDAILHYIVSNWGAVYPEVLKILQQRETDALKACQAYVDEMQAAINEASA